MLQKDVRTPLSIVAPSQPWILPFLILTLCTGHFCLPPQGKSEIMNMMGILYRMMVDAMGKVPRVFGVGTYTPLRAGGAPHL